MAWRVVWAFAAGAMVLFGSELAHAQCTKDIDCKGDRVCEAGACTDPVPPAASTPDGANAGPGVPSTEGAAPAPEGQPEAPPAAAPALPASESGAAPQGAAPASTAATKPLGSDEPAVRRRSRGMMVGGIVMVSIGPIALLGALSARNSQENCDEDLERRYPDHMVPSYDARALDRCDDYTTPIYILGIGGAVLVAAGLPMIIYGAKNVPDKPAVKAQLLPWATPGSGGLRLRVDL